MEKINDFYPSKRVKKGSIFTIYDHGELSVTEIVQVGGIKRGDQFGRVFKMICLTSAMPFGNEIETYESSFYRKPKKTPVNRIWKPEQEVFTLEDIQWLLGDSSGKSLYGDDVEIHYMGDFSWAFGYNMRDIERQILLNRGLQQVGRLEAQLKALLQVDEEEGS